jgi:hypothetical protein
MSDKIAGQPGPGEPWPELWRRFGRPGAVTTLRMTAHGLIVESTMMIPPGDGYRDELASIIIALSDLADRIQQDHDQSKEGTTT